uniref:Uncharacterized protein n=1 Tax=Crocodylus porosus TaxID=8502 RepID=A0A7M4EZN4_CROPO
MLSCNPLLSCIGLHHNHILSPALIIQIHQGSEVTIEEVKLEDLRDVTLNNLVHDLCIGSFIWVSCTDPGHNGAHRAVLFHKNVKFILFKDRWIVI